MASPNVKYDDILTTTLEHRNKKLADNVTNNNALLRKLKERGKIRTIDGGSKIVEELEYGEGDMMWYSGYDEINYTPKQLFTAAEYNMKLCAVPVAISGEDMLKNSGRERIMNLFEKRIENAEKTMMNQMAKAIYGDGTENSGKSISGLKLLVADAPATGTIGGIDRASNAWWRNQSKTATAAFTSETLRPAMNAMWLSLCRGTDRPDLIVTDDTMYSLFEESLTPLQRFSDSKTADAGFTNLLYKQVPVVFDGGHGGNCPKGHMYFLNTNYIYLRPHKDRQFKVIGGERMAINQDAIYKILGWAGNMTMSNAFTQGVLLDKSE